MRLSEENILDILKDYNVIEEGHFLLSSGLHSDKYVQCARLFQYPEISGGICQELASKLKGYKIDKVVGPAMGGILPAYEISRSIGKPNIFAEREKGKMTFKRGFEISDGEKILITEDVVTTGKSVLEVIDQVEREGGVVTLVASLIDRSGGEVGFEVPYISLIKLGIKNYEPSDCPLCEQGMQLEKPGSR